MNFLGEMKRRTQKKKAKQSRSIFFMNNFELLTRIL